MSRLAKGPSCDFSVSGRLQIGAGWRGARTEGRSGCKTTIAASLSRALLRASDGGGCAATLEARTSAGLAVAAVMGPAAACDDDDDDAAALCRVAAVHPASRLYLRLEADQPLRQTHATVQLALRYTAAAPPHERRLRVLTFRIPVAADAAAAAAAAEAEATALAAAFGVALRAESGAALGAAAGARARALVRRHGAPNEAVRRGWVWNSVEVVGWAPPPALTPALRLLCAVEGCAKGGGQEAARALGGAAADAEALWVLLLERLAGGGARLDAAPLASEAVVETLRRHATNERASVGAEAAAAAQAPAAGGGEEAEIV